MCIAKMKENGMGNEKKTNYLSFVINYNIILLIPMLIVVLSTYFVVKEHNLQRVMTEAKLKTESQSKYWEQEMSVLSLHYNDCRYSKLDRKSTRLNSSHIH